MCILTSCFMDQGNALPSETSAGRALITNAMVSEMTKSYRMHFSQYSKGRKKVVQRLPKQVWESVYKDVVNMEGFGNVKEASLKKQIKATLGDISTGDADDGANDNAILQNDNLIDKLKETDSYASRNVLNLRENLVVGLSAPKPNQPKSSSSNCIRSTPTKADAYAAVQSMADTMESMLSDRAQFTEKFEAGQKRKLQMAEQSLELKQKRLEFDKESLLARIQVDRDRLDMDKDKAKAEQLIQLHKAGIISKEELLQKMQV